MLDVTCCVCLHTLLHVVACCWELLRKVWNRSNFQLCENGHNKSLLLKLPAVGSFPPFSSNMIIYLFFFLQEKGQSSVFSRLGELASPATQTTVQAVNPRVRLPSDDEPHAGVDYTSHSVLQPVKRKGNQAKPVKPVKPVKRTLGLTSDVDEKSVFARLGSKVQQWKCSNF